MIYPNYDKFCKLADKFDRITVFKEIFGDTTTPITLLKRFSTNKNVFLLESADSEKKFSRFSYFGIDPEKVIIFKDNCLLEYNNCKSTILKSSFDEYIKQNLASNRSFGDPAFGDFSGGYVGFTGYDMLNQTTILRRKLSKINNDLLMGLMLIENFYVFDNHKRKLFAAISVKTGEDLKTIYKNADGQLDNLAMLLQNNEGAKTDNSESKFEIKREMDKEIYMDKVTKIKKEIENGEVIQCVLSNKYEVLGHINPVSFYRILRNINPSAYMFYLKFDDIVLMGSSPETHLKIVDKKALLKPIAGTYPVGEDIDKIKDDLLADEKEVSEHLMLLDLARNDLTTACDPLSVKVDKSFIPEVYSHVVHIVSEVTGELGSDKSPLDLFINTFPAGTVSGAPKVRAMELIDKYEVSSRGFYAGCAGYFSFNGNIDTCILIRSALVEEKTTTLRAGGGIVYDSVPEKEYMEVENKLMALLKSLEKISDMEKQDVFISG